MKRFERVHSPRSSADAVPAVELGAVSGGGLGSDRDGGPRLGLSDDLAWAEVRNQYSSEQIQQWRQQGDGENSVSDVPTAAQKAWGWKVTDEEIARERA